MIYFVRVVASGDIWNTLLSRYSYEFEVSTVEVVCDNLVEAKQKAVDKLYREKPLYGTFRACIVAVVEEYHEDPFEYIFPSSY